MVWAIFFFTRNWKTWEINPKACEITKKLNINAVILKINHMTNKENITNKDTLVARIKKGITEEKRLVGKIIGQVKSAKKNPQTRLNIDEKQLRTHLNEVIKSWEERKIPKIINNFLEEIKAGLQKKEDIIIWGYFSLKVRRSLPRTARNPQTGEPISIKAKNRISFRASPKLKKEIN